MPNKKLEAFRVNSDKPDIDRRRKLTDPQREDLRLEYLAGGTSYRKIAIKYGVSKRLAIFIVNPEKQEANHAIKTPERVKYYNRNHTAAVRTHRAHKRNLMEVE